MKPHRDRGIAPELAIGIVACAASYFFFVKPTAQHAAAERASADALATKGFCTSGTGKNVPSVSDLRHSLENLATAARDLHERGRSAFNEAEMLTSLAGLAATHKLQLEQMQPVLPTNKKPAPGPDEPPPPDDREIGYTLTLKGEYAQLTAFLRAFAQTFPMAQVVSIRVSASMERDGPPILAILTTRHCAFDALPAARVAEAAAQLPE